MDLTDEQWERLAPLFGCCKHSSGRIEEHYRHKTLIYNTLSYKYMQKFRVKIKFYDDPNGRLTPFSSGYRPTFLFQNIHVSGDIALTSKQKLHPGEEDIAEILIASDHLIEGKFAIGDRISFWEAPVKIGEAEILEILPKV